MEEFDFDRLLKSMDEMPDDAFPSFMFTPVINVFDDDELSRIYWQNFDESNDLVNKMMLMSNKKYSDYYDYMDAMDTFYDYVQPYVDQYGSLNVVLDAASNGILSIFIPEKPKLKARLKKKIKKLGFIPARTYFDPNFVGYYDAISDTIDSSEIKESDDRAKVDKLTKMSLKEASKASTITNRLSALRSNTTSDVFAEVKQLENLLKSRTSYRKDISNYDEYSIHDILKRSKEIENTPDHTLFVQEMDDDVFGAGCVIYKGGSNYITIEEYHKKEMLRLFLEAGINPNKATSSINLSKESVAMVASNVTDLDENSKLYKKLEKRKKKKIKALHKKFKSSEFSELSNSIFSLTEEEELRNFKL